MTQRWYGILDEIGNVHGHLLDLGAVKLLNLTHHADVVSGDKVDGDTLSAETTTTTDTVDVVLAVGGKIVVDDQGDLLDINTTGQQVSGNQDTRGAGSELLHNQVTLSLVHVTVHGRDSEVASSELVGEPVDLAAGVAEDNSLGDGDCLVQVRESVELPLLLLNSNVELLNTLKGKLVLLDQNADGVTHELGGDLEDILGHGGRQKNNLGRLGQELEDIVDLLGETALRKAVSTQLRADLGYETYRKHFVGLVKDKHLHAVRLEEAALDHIVNTAGSTNNDLGAVLQSLHVITNAGTADAGVALNVHEVTNGNDDLLDLLSKLTGGSEDQSLALLQVGVDLLEDRDGESGSLSGTRLGLCDDIVACIVVLAHGVKLLEIRECLTLDDGHDSTLLDGGRTLETVSVDALLPG